MIPFMADPRPQPLVLVADDDNNLRKILCIFLKNAHYETVEAANGREALQMAKSQSPDLILMDIMMPMLDGFTVCKLLKDDPDTKRILVLICTAKNRKEDLVAAIKAGAEDYIIKPFTKDTVLSKIEKAMAARMNQSSSKMMSAVERRDSRRNVAGWSLSCGGQSQGGLAPVYQTREYGHRDTEARRRPFGHFSALWLRASAAVLVLLGGCSSASPAPEIEFWAGVAAVEITPTRNVPLGGYGGRKGQPMTGVHDPIFAKALWLETPESRGCLVTTDLIGSLGSLRGRIRPPHAPRVLTPSHSPSGPRARGQC